MNKLQVHIIAERAFRIGIALAIVAFLFRIMHWPFQGVLSTVSEAGLVASFLFLYWATPEKTIFHHITLGAAILILLNLIFPYLNLGVNPLSKYKNIAIFGLIVPEISSLFSNKHNDSELNQKLNGYEFGQDEEVNNSIPSEGTNKHRASVILLGIGAFPVVVGLLFKIQHYPGASMLLTFGFGISAIGVFLLFIKK